LLLYVLIEANLSSERTQSLWQDWLDNGRCCPSYRKDSLMEERGRGVDYDNHDTLGMLAIDMYGDMACGTSSNGLSFRVAGRVGSSAIPGAGTYCDNDIGGATATGDGDIILRFFPSLKAVEVLIYNLFIHCFCRTWVEE
jgi:N4-(beta-N-acetylglucosaminyl)-L-asparaginase